MRTIYFKIAFAGLIAILFISSVFIVVPIGQAQSSQPWSNPINLSNAGSSTNPALVIDAAGTMHAVWLDLLDGYKYAKSTDRVSWTAPKTVRFPFDLQDEAQPVFLADPNGGLHVLWRDKTFTLYYSKVASDPDVPSNWRSTRKLASGVIDFDAVVSPQGVLHVGYVSSLVTETNQAGVYYIQFKGTSSSKPLNLYASQYFRSTRPEDANIRLAVSEQNELETVYMVWDDRSQRRIFMSKSLDGGSLWESNTTIQSSENSAGLELPFNVNIGVEGSKLLLLWQSGIPGGPCAQYSQWSVDGGDQFGIPERMLNGIKTCPQVSEFVVMNEAYAVVWLNILDDISLVAWNGSSWSEPHSQNEVVTFINPLTFESVLFACQELSIYDGQLLVVGCDKGLGGDIWFSSRSVGTVKEWFPSSAEWDAPVEVASSDQQVSVLTSVADTEGNIHAFWVQPPLRNTPQGRASIQYARWNGERWSLPTTILSGLHPGVTQLSVQADSQNKLLLAWVDSKAGDIFFSWANTAQANKPSEWKKPQYLSSASQSNSSPDILTDASDRVIVVYAVPINEGRGVYFVESEDGGITWTQQFQVFDAESAGWDIVAQPNISLTGDGRLHVLFRRYALRGEQRQSLGLYYSQSVDGGVNWSEPEAVSEHPVVWSEIFAYDRSVVHRMWQEYDKSTLLSFHQVSEDGGTSWSKSIIVSSIDDSTTNLTAQAMDRAGNMHLLQMTGRDNLLILDEMWNGSRWTSQEPKELYISGRGVPSSISASVSSKGNLVVSVLADYPYTTDEFKRSILSVSKDFGLAAGLQTPYPAVIPAAVVPTVVVAATEEALASLPASTQNSPVVDINKATSSLSGNKNLVGFLLLGGMLLLLIVIFRPIARKQAHPKKTSQ